MDELTPKQQNLVIENIHIIPGAVHTMYNKMNRFQNEEDLTSDAQIGLMRAALAFDKSFGVPFRTYAYQKMHFEMLDGIRKRDFVPRLERECIKKDPEHRVCHTYSLSINWREHPYYQIPSHKHGPSHYVDIKDEVEFFLGLLSAKRRKLLKMYFYEGMTYKSIAESYGYHEAAIVLEIQKTMVEINEFRKMGRGAAKQVANANREREKCIIPGCSAQRKKRRLCAGHLCWETSDNKEERMMFKKYAARTIYVKRTCEVPDCAKIRQRRGLCMKHYKWKDSDNKEERTIFKKHATAKRS